MYNPCPIPATLQLFCESRHSAYTVEPREIELAPLGTGAVTVYVFLDDTLTYSETLHVSVVEGQDYPVKLSATGAHPAVAPRSRFLGDTIAAWLDAGLRYWEGGNTLGCFSCCRGAGFIGKPDACAPKRCLGGYRGVAMSGTNST